MDMDERFQHMFIISVFLGSCLVFLAVCVTASEVAMFFLVAMLLAFLLVVLLLFSMMIQNGAIHANLKSYVAGIGHKRHVEMEHFDDMLAEPFPEIPEIPRKTVNGDIEEAFSRNDSSLVSASAPTIHSYDASSSSGSTLSAGPMAYACRGPGH